MIQINDTISFEPGIELNLQSPEFIQWFNDTILIQIDFANSCTTRDEFSRPKTWEFQRLTVMVIYFTESVNYNFNKFVIYGTI